MSNEMTDLDWLARNVHEWKEGKIECIPMSPYKVENVVWSSRSPCEGWITKDQWLSRRAELQNKPSWDQHAWPQIFQNEDGHWFGARDGWDFKAHIGKGWKGDGVSLLGTDGGYLSSGEILGDWRDTLERRPADLSEAAVTERLGEATQNVLAGVPGLMDEKYRFDRNNWHERGELPPVGIECEIFLDGGWGRVFIAGVSRGGNPVAEFGPGNIAECEDCKFRPIRTERDHLVDVLSKAGIGSYALIAADAILAAGFKMGAR